MGAIGAKEFSYNSLEEYNKDLANLESFLQNDLQNISISINFSQDKNNVNDQLITNFCRNAQILFHKQDYNLKLVEMKLNFSECSNLSDISLIVIIGLLKVFQFFRSLEISFNNCAKITDQSAIMLLSYLKTAVNLMKIKFSCQNSQISQKALEQIHKLSNDLNMQYDPQSYLQGSIQESVVEKNLLDDRKEVIQQQQQQEQCQQQQLQQMPVPVEKQEQQEEEVVKLTEQQFKEQSNIEVQDRQEIEVQKAQIKQQLGEKVQEEEKVTEKIINPEDKQQEQLQQQQEIIQNQNQIKQGEEVKQQGNNENHQPFYASEKTQDFIEQMANYSNKVQSVQKVYQKHLTAQIFEKNIIFGNLDVLKKSHSAYYEQIIKLKKTTACLIQDSEYEMFKQLQLSQDIKLNEFNPDIHIIKDSLIKNEFSQDYVKKCPTKYEATIQVLAMYLESNLMYNQGSAIEKQVEKFFRIYSWICQHIRFNFEILKKGELGENQAQDVLRNKLAVSSGYCNLFCVLAEEMKLITVKICGIGKGLGYFVGKSFEQDIGHTWVACMIEQNWYLVDPTYGVDEKRFETNFHYFLTEPKNFGIEHYPDNLNWQLLPKEDQINYQNFLSSPWIKPALWSKGIEILDFNTTGSLIVEQNPLKIRLKCNQPNLAQQTQIRTILTEKNNQQEIQYSGIAYFIENQNIFELLVDFPHKNEYHLKIYVGDKFNNKDNTTFFGAEFIVNYVGPHTKGIQFGFPQAPNFFDYKLKLLNLQKADFSTHCAEKLKLIIPFSDSKISAQLKLQDKQPMQFNIQQYQNKPILRLLEQACIIKILSENEHEKLVEIQFDFPISGVYSFKVFAGKSQDQYLKHCLDYVITYLGEEKTVNFGYPQQPQFFKQNLQIEDNYPAFFETDQIIKFQLGTQDEKLQILADILLIQKFDGSKPTQEDQEKLKNNFIIQKSLRSSSTKEFIKDVLIDLPEPGKYQIKIFCGSKQQAQLAQCLQYEVTYKGEKKKNFGYPQKGDYELYGLELVSHKQKNLEINHNLQKFVFKMHQQAYDNLTLFSGLIHVTLQVETKLKNYSQFVQKNIKNEIEIDIVFPYEGQYRLSIYPKLNQPSSSIADYVINYVQDKSLQYQDLIQFPKIFAAFEKFECYLVKPRMKYFNLNDEVEFEIQSNSKCKKMLIVGDSKEYNLTCQTQTINSRFYVYSGKFPLTTNIVSLFGSEDLLSASITAILSYE